jgi:hypothetical protein
MKKLVMILVAVMMNSAYAYAYKCKGENESVQMVVKFPQSETHVFLTHEGEGTIELKGKQSGYERVSHRADKYFYTLKDKDQAEAELTMIFMTRGGRFGVIPGKSLAANFNTTLTYQGEKTFYACFNTYQD